MTVAETLTEMELGIMPETDLEARLIAEVRRLRQGLFECFRLAGGDTDGDDGPQAWTGDIVERVTQVVRDLRQSYDEDAEALDAEVGAHGGSLPKHPHDEATNSHEWQEWQLR